MSVAMDMPDAETLYRALCSRDARLDGSVFYGIVSTGIYCRPVCPARTPRFSNCRFYASAAAAQSAGFRPCLRCRPETAPRCAAWQGTSVTVSRALALIEDGALDGDNASVESLASRLGVGERHLRRLFLKHLGASPIAVAQTRRVLFAKQLLHDTALPMSAVAQAAGFGSERRFHEVFQSVFQRPPSAIRRAATTCGLSTGVVTLRIRYHAPYLWSAMLDSLRSTCRTGLDAVCGDGYERTLTRGTLRGSVQVTHDPKRTSLIVAIQWPVLRDLPAILSRVRRLFDTDADILRMEEHLSQDASLALLIAAQSGLRVAGSWDNTSASTLLEGVTDQPANWQPWGAYAAAHLRLAERLKEKTC